MKQINAQDVLDIAMAGTSATLLAKRWESALLVNVDNDTLSRLLNNKDALDALMRIEGFRSLNQDITMIINKSESVKKAKKENDGKLSEKEKKEISAEEKEYKSMRKQIQEKLIKFATRVPVFMYLTDYRERSLKDVITQLEPGLFKKVTGLDVKDFELLCSIGVFNASLMNDAIFKFKRYEDSSLSYTGIEKHVSDEVGGWDTVIKKAEYEKLFYNQQASLSVSDFGGDNTIEEIAVTETPAQTENHGDVLSSVIKTTVIERQKEEPKISVDLSKIEPGSEVYHQKFGLGKVIGIDKLQKYIKIAFSVGEKMFIYPSAFEKGFLEIK